MILANGDFPRRGTAARRILEEAARVVACDGAADAYRRRFGHPPTLTVGDLDSLAPSTKHQAPVPPHQAPSTKHQAPVPPHQAPSTILRIDEQETNDLAKAVRVCRARGWWPPVILGATGKREDHTLGNLFRALDFGLAVVTDRGCFIPVEGRATLRVRPGAAVSVFAPDPATRMTSVGLEWPLDGLSFPNLYCATLNRATAPTVTLTATHRVFVFINGNQR